MTSEFGMRTAQTASKHEEHHASKQAASKLTSKQQATTMTGTYDIVPPAGPPAACQPIAAAFPLLQALMLMTIRL